METFALYVCDIPKGYGLFNIQQLIVKIIGDEDGLRSIDYVKLKDNSHVGVDSTAEIRLRTQAYATKLLQQEVIALSYEDQPHLVKIRDGLDFESINVRRKDIKNSASNNDHEERVFNTEPQRPAESNIDRQRTGLYCTRIPLFMYNRKTLMDYFNQYGKIKKLFLPVRPTRERYIKLMYDSHASAKFALENAGDLGERTPKMRIEWDRNELRKIVENLAQQPRQENDRPRSSRGRFEPKFNNRQNSRQTTSGDKPSTSSNPAQRRSSGPRQSSDARPSRTLPLRKSVSSPTFSSAAVKATCTWDDLLEKDEKLFEGDPTRAVILQSSKDLSEVRLKNYFTQSKFCRSDEIESIHKIFDGYLIVFSRPETATNVIEGDNHVIDNEKVKVLKKVLPAVFEDRFLLQGSFSNVDDVETLLGCCDDDIDIKPEITEADQPDMYLIKYDRNVDIKAIKTAIENTPLEDTEPKVVRVCRTDCIKVENLTPDIGNDVIRLTFMNRKNGCTGKTTKVERVQDGSDFLIFVYFGNFEDSERIVAKAEANKLLVSGVEAHISLYYHSMSNDHKFDNSPRPTQRRVVDEKPAVLPRRPVRPFEYQPKVKDEIVHFVRNFPVLVDQLKAEFKNLADIEFQEKFTGRDKPTVVLAIKPALDTMPSEYKYNQVKFRERCSDLIFKFMNKFASTSANYDDKNLADLRHCNSWNNDADFISVELKSNVFADVYVRWNNLRPGHVTVTGWQDEVIGVLQFIKQNSDVCEDKLVFNQSAFRAMQECKVFDEVKKAFKGTIKIEDDSENFTICFKGPRNSVAGAKSQTADNKMKLMTGVLPDLGEVSKYLQTSLQNCESGPDMIAVQQILQADFDDKKIEASLQLIDDQVCVLYVKQSEMSRAQKALMEIIKHQTLHVRKGIDELVSSAEWKRLRQNICTSGSVQVFVDKGKSKIIVVGLAYTFEEALRPIKEHVKVNATTTSTIPERYVVVNYFKTFKDVFGEDGRTSLKDVEIEWRTARDKPSAVVITGKQADVDAASQWVQNAIARFSVATCKFADHGIPEYFRSKDGTDSLKAIAERRQCIALVDPPEWQTSAPRGSATSRNFGPAAKVTVRVPHTRVTLSLLQTDITESHCDAIINASNEDLELRPAGVSGSILSKGGHAIQKEMTSYVSTSGKLRAGQVISTSAGELGFKRIIHAVGPKWSPDAEFEYKRDLKKCVKNSLLEASKHGLKSIAMPAVSCGVFGGKPSVSVPVLVKAAVDYVQENENCSVTQIDFVENSNPQIIAEFEREISNVSDSPSSTPPQTPTRKPIPRPRPTFSSTPTSPTSTPTLSVRIADISTVTAQVIVTSSTPSNMQSGQVTAVSKALCKGAGLQLQNACMMAGSANLQIGDVIETSGFNLNCLEVYHAMLINYDSNLGSKLLNTVIQKCLSKADSSSYASIAFPTLGAGGFGYPPGLVARTFKSVVANFRASKLRTVHLVVYPSDQAALQAVQSELYFASSWQTFSDAQSSAPKWKNVSVSVNTGDLLALTCDVIVNSTKNFGLTGEVGKAICAKGGRSIAVECAGNPLRSSATYRVTRGGNLSCKYIVHVNTPKDPNQLRAAIVDVLKVAEELQMNSIGFPAIGTGNIGMPSRDAARSIDKAIKDFDQSNPRHLRTIRVCVFQQQMFSEFQQRILGSQQQSSFFDAVKARLGFGKAKVLKPKLPSLLPNASSRKSQVSVSILVCSYQEDNVNEVMQNVQDKVKELSRVMFIEDESLKDLTHSEEHELLVIGKKHKVLIEREQKHGVVSLSISGLTNPVLEAHTASFAVVHQFKEALLCSEYVMWRYKDQRSGEMTDFPLRANNELEKSYKKNSNGSVVVDIYINGSTQKFRVDFSSKKETCLRTNHVTEVERRAQAADDPLPSNWDTMGGQPFKLVPLANPSQEYASVMQQFNQNLPLRSVVQLERIQNPTLYKQFQAQKKKVEGRMGSGAQVTRQLFHGTSGDVCDKIYKDGFDRSHAGKHATAYGSGVYFATTASYSNGYAQPDSQGRRRMFLADVITGQYCRGSSGMQTVPMQANGTPFDSVVNNTAGPSMYIVFKDASVYPSYILTYT